MYLLAFDAMALEILESGSSLLEMWPYSSDILTHSHNDKSKGWIA
jgi:hypothetical protein